MELYINLKFLLMKYINYTQNFRMISSRVHLLNPFKEILR